MPLTRRIFLGATGLVGAAALAACTDDGDGEGHREPSKPFDPLPETALDDPDIDRDFLQMLAAHADDLLLDEAAALEEFLAGEPNARSTMRELKLLIATYFCEQSAHHLEERLIEHARTLAERVADLRTESGLFDAGGNLQSPPDSCFSLVDMVTVKRMLDLYDEDEAHSEVKEMLDDVAPDVAHAVVTSHGGGVHTANHRWEVAGALFEVNSIWPDDDLVTRGREWLAEGIDVYDDGHYSERSTIYDSEVVNPSLLRIARNTDDGDLVELVRRNLKLALTLTSPDGTVETVHSRRQDQNEIRPDWWYLLQYREFALRDEDSTFAFQADRIMERSTSDAGVFLGDVLSQPALARELPPAEEPALDDREDYLDSSGLLILRRGNAAATVFAGSDYPEFGTVASGLSTNPTFFKYRKGAAELASMRVSPQFFSMGPLRPSTISEDGDSVQLTAEHVTGYHTPITTSGRLRSDGMYALEDDGRFWSAMSFNDRERADLAFSCDISVTEHDGGFVVELDTDSPETLVVMQLTFAGDGAFEFDLDHVRPDEENVEGARPYLLTGPGSFTWQVDDDSVQISIEEVAPAGEDLEFDSGEEYTYLNGFLPAPTLEQVLIPFRAPGTFLISIT